MPFLLYILLLISLTAFGFEKDLNTINASISALLEEAWKEYHKGHFEKARQLFREVESKESDNIEAKRGLICIARYFEKEARLDYQTMRNEMLEEVERAWQPALLNKQIKAPRSSPIVHMKERLEGLWIDKLSFTEASLPQAIDQLADFAEKKGLHINLLIAAPPSSETKLTLTLRQMHLQRALEYVAMVSGLQLEFSEDAVVLRPAEGPGGEALLTEFFHLSRGTVARLSSLDDRFEKTGAGRPLEAKQLIPATTLEEEMAIRGFLQRAGISFDQKGCTLAFDGTQLVVTQTARQMERLKRILERYENTYQVEIEAKFMEVQQGALEELGFQWRLNHKNDYVRTQNALGKERVLRDLSDAFTRQNASMGPGSIVLEPPSSAIPIPNLPPAFPGSINLGAMAGNLANISGIISGWNIDMVVRALEQQTGADLMSAPKLTVLSGKTAEIVVAREFRYPESYGKIDSAVGTTASTALTGGSAGVTITAGTPQNFVTRPVGVQMEVTPTVEDEGKRISLRLEPRVTEFEGFVEYGGRSVAISGGTTVDVPSGFFQPIFSVRHIRTEMTIENGATVIMGGLAREEQKTVNDKVPILGDLPFIGRFFRSEGQSNQKKSLLILVTGNVLLPGGMPSKLGDQKSFSYPSLMTPGGLMQKDDEGAPPIL